jgi:hypothetical protein
MTRLRPPRSVAAEGPGEAGAGGGDGSGAGAAAPAGSPGATDVPPDGRLRRRRLAGPAARSGLATEGGGATIAGVSGTGPLVCAPGRRLPRRLRGAAAAAGSWGRCSLATTCRLTLAPTSPSAHRVPSAVWRSTRHTTIEVGAPPTGGRFCVSVQRA